MKKENKTKLPFDEVLEHEEGYNSAWWYDNHPDHETVLTSEFDDDDGNAVIEVNNREDGFAGYVLDTNIDTLKAINLHIMTVLKPKAETYHNNDPILWAPRWYEWKKAISEWQPWYALVSSSWYVTDDDLANAKFRRDKMNMIVMPEATKFVKAWAKDGGKNGGSYSEKQKTDVENAQPMSLTTKLLIGAGVITALVVGGHVAVALISVAAGKKMLTAGVI
jgi:hypothetical protein